MQLFRVLVLLSVSISIPVMAADPLAAFLGTYEFEDGTRVTGGRFDEAGTGLLYLDTWHQRLGGVFPGTGPVFESAFSLDVVTFSDDGESMSWQDGSQLRKAKRTLHPATRAVSFNSHGLTLRGTLYLPEGRVSGIPGIVLAHGSGAVSRYAGTWITFFVEQGMAVLSYDKRGVGESQGNWKQATYAELADDLSAAINTLRAQPEVNPARVGVHTTSQSGWYGPSAARKNGHVAFLIQRAGPAVDIGLGTAHELRMEWEARELGASIVLPAASFWIQLHELAANGGSLAAARSKLAEARRQSWFQPTFGNWSSISPDWWKRHSSNMQLQPAEDAADTSIPMLWFLAENDENVPYRASIAALQDAKKKNPRIDVVTVHDAPHSFLLRAADGSQHYTPEYWQVMATWLTEKGFSAPR